MKNIKSNNVLEFIRRRKEELLARLVELEFQRDFASALLEQFEQATYPKMRLRGLPTTLNLEASTEGCDRSYRDGRDVPENTALRALAPVLAKPKKLRRKQAKPAKSMPRSTASRSRWWRSTSNITAAADGS